MLYAFKRDETGASCMHSLSNKFLSIWVPILSHSGHICSSTTRRLLIHLLPTVHPALKQGLALALVNLQSPKSSLDGDAVSSYSIKSNMYAWDTFVRYIVGEMAIKRTGRVKQTYERTPLSKSVGVFANSCSASRRSILCTHMYKSKIG